jgi:hypothetical protein
VSLHEAIIAANNTPNGRYDHFCIKSEWRHDCDELR